MLRPIVAATLIAGTLDILFAFVMAGMSVIAVLRFVASGPFGAAPTESFGWALVGLAVHSLVLGCGLTAILAGIGYGVLLWIVMYWIVMPLRFDMPLPRGITAVAQQLFAHCLLVGVPIAWLAPNAFRREALCPR